MYENIIQILRKDLTKEFHALAQTHTEEFNDNQMLLRVDSEAFEYLT